VFLGIVNEYALLDLFLGVVNEYALLDSMRFVSAIPSVFCSRFDETYLYVDIFAVDMLSSYKTAIVRCFRLLCSTLSADVTQ